MMERSGGVLLYCEENGAVNILADIAKSCAISFLSYIFQDIQL